MKVSKCQYRKNRTYRKTGHTGKMPIQEKQDIQENRTYRKTGHTGKIGHTGKQDIQ
jgi:hypothetical protein